MSARTRELFGLIPVSLLVAAGFAAVLATRTQDVSDATLTYGAVFLGLCVIAHLFIRARLPDADPYLFPLSALLAAIGLVLIYRIDADLAREQAQWFVVGLVFFCGTILAIRDHHVLERYRYTIAAVSIVLLAMPRLPGIGGQVNGAFLAIKLGPIQFQPAEVAKLGIIIFLASYLRETGDILVRPRLRPLPFQRQLLLYGLPALLTLLAILVLDLGAAEAVLLAVFVGSLVAVLRERPSPKHFGPLLLVWGLAMLMLIVIRDLGSSLMFFGGFLALLYAATGGCRWSARGRRCSSAVRCSSRTTSPMCASGWTSGWTRSSRAWWTTRATRSPSRCSRRPTAASSDRASVARCSSYPEVGRSCPPRTPTSSTRCSPTRPACSAPPA